MCPHCLTSTGGCVHCHERPLRPPTVASIANARLAAPGRGVQKSCLTVADRAALGLFPKPWRGVAAGRHYTSPTPGPDRPAALQEWRGANCVLPAGFHF